MAQESKDIRVLEASYMSNVSNPTYLGAVYDFVELEKMVHVIQFCLLVDMSIVS